MFLSQGPDWAEVFDLDIFTFPSVLFFVLRVGKSDSGYETWIESNRRWLPQFRVQDWKALKVKDPTFYEQLARDSENS